MKRLWVDSTKQCLRMCSSASLTVVYISSRSRASWLHRYGLKLFSSGILRTECITLTKLEISLFMSGILFPISNGLLSPDCWTIFILECYCAEASYLWEGSFDDEFSFRCIYGSIAILISNNYLRQSNYIKKLYLGLYS